MKAPLLPTEHMDLRAIIFDRKDVELVVLLSSSKRRVVFAKVIVQGFDFWKDVYSFSIDSLFFLKLEMLLIYLSAYLLGLVRKI